jgi:hypothetical protein
MSPQSIIDAQLSKGFAFNGTLYPPVKEISIILHTPFHDGILILPLNPTLREPIFHKTAE